MNELISKPIETLKAAAWNRNYEIMHAQEMQINFPLIYSNNNNNNSSTLFRL